MNSDLTTIAAQPLLAGLPEHYLQLLTDLSTQTRLDVGEFLFREGAEAECFHLILNGKVALELHAHNRGAITIQTLGKGEVAGWSWLFPPFVWQFDARVLAVTETVSFNGTTLREHCNKDHELGYQLIKRFANIIAQRLQATRLQLINIYDENK